MTGWGSCSSPFGTKGTKENTRNRSTNLRPALGQGSISRFAGQARPPGDVAPGAIDTIQGGVRGANPRLCEPPPLAKGRPGGVSKSKVGGAVCPTYKNMANDANDDTGEVATRASPIFWTASTQQNKGLDKYENRSRTPNIV